MAKKRKKKKATSARGRFRTKIYPGVRNEEVLDKLFIIQKDPKYVSHSVLPEGGGKSSLIVVFRR